MPYVPPNAHGGCPSRCLYLSVLTLDIEQGQAICCADEDVSIHCQEHRKGRPDNNIVIWNPRYDAAPKTRQIKKSRQDSLPDIRANISRTT